MALACPHSGTQLVLRERALIHTSRWYRPRCCKCRPKCQRRSSRCLSRNRRSCRSSCTRLFLPSCRIDSSSNRCCRCTNRPPRRMCSDWGCFHRQLSSLRRSPLRGSRSALFLHLSSLLLLAGPRARVAKVATAVDVAVASRDAGWDASAVSVRSAEQRATLRIGGAWRVVWRAASVRSGVGASVRASVGTDRAECRAALRCAGAARALRPRIPLGDRVLRSRVPAVRHARAVDVGALVDARVERRADAVV